MQPPIVPDADLRRQVATKDRQIEELTSRLEAIENNQVTYTSMKESGKCPKCDSTKIFNWWRYSLKYHCRDCGFEEKYKPTDAQNWIGPLILLFLAGIAIFVTPLL